MDGQLDLDQNGNGGIERLPLVKFSEEAYLDYSMYVINNRALPFVGDGLKPVQRRIIYTMASLGINHTSKPAKAARTIGEVIGKFHPHGEDACYESMVLMAQDFSLRYPLIDGQGNWGAPDDPKSFAAARYTESRLSQWAPLVLAELRQGTVEYQQNYDGTLEEPKFLPAQVPLLLLNGSTGIAVGMATDVPPHNLQEVTQACIAMLRSRPAPLSEILEIIKGPDLPTRGLITSSKQEIEEVYKTGRGTLRNRAKYTMERSEIVITELPYQASPSRILAQIADQMQSKKLPQLVDIRDESDYEHPIRLVLEPRSNRIDIPRLMDHLFATTDLEQSLKMNMNVIGLDRKPRVMPLRTVLSEWIEFRRLCVKRRLEHRKTQITARLHIIDALLIVFLHIEDVVNIIREYDDAEIELMARFGLDEDQTRAVLDLRMRQLARLQEIELKQEKQDLQMELINIEKPLASTTEMNALIRSELKAVLEEYGDERRTEITQVPESKAFSDIELIPNEPITVILSEKGWVRAAKGHEIDPSDLTYRTGDGYLNHVRARTIQTCAFFDSGGRVYSCAIQDLPTARGQGEPLSGRFSIESQRKIVGLHTLSEGEFLVAAQNGYGFVAPSTALSTNVRKGKVLCRLTDDWKLIPPVLVGACRFYFVVTSEGYLLLSEISELPKLNSGRGVRLIGITRARLQQKVEYAKFMGVIGEKDTLVLRSGKRILNLRNNRLLAYVNKRTTRGKVLSKGFRNVDSWSIVSKVSAAQ